MIEIKDLEKSYGNFKVLKDMDLKIETGKMNYIVGPNGSGKTTLIKSILGLVKINSGKITIANYRLNGDCKYREKIGYMPQSASFPENLTVKEIFTMVKDFRDNKTKYDEELIEQFHLNKEMSKRLKNLSGGTKQKVNAAIAFLFEPEILILDEPTAGLDPVSSSMLKDKIIKEHKNGKTIILTSHILSELEELAEKVIFLLDGNIQFNGTLINLIKSTEQKNLERAIATLMNGNAA